MKCPLKRKSTLGVVPPTRHLRRASPEVRGPAKPFANSPRAILLSLEVVHSLQEGSGPLLRTPALLAHAARCFGLPREPEQPTLSLPVLHIYRILLHVVLPTTPIRARNDLLPQSYRIRFRLAE